jgi:hypothetical protein
LPALAGNDFGPPGTNLNVQAIARAIIVIVGMSGVVHAEGKDKGGKTEPTRKRRTLAVAASVVPGALIHGSGHYVLGERRTARRLLKMEGVGLGLLGAGGALMGISGTDENLSVLFVPLMVSGGTIVAGSFLADLLGVALPSSASDAAASRPGWPRPDAIAATSVGYRYVLHPALAVDHVARASGALRLGGLRLAVAAEAGAHGTYRAQEMVTAYRLPWRPLASSSLEVGFDVAHRELPNDGVGSTPMSIWAEAVWDLRDRVPRLPGAYARGRLGLGVELIDYGAIAGWLDEVGPFVAATAGLGLRLGRVDAELFYDHRKDGLPGGGFFGRLPGMLGSLGVASRLRLPHKWAFTGEARYGTGLTTWVAAERSF